jgi:hypothetical protein
MPRWSSSPAWAGFAVLGLACSPAKQSTVSDDDARPAFAVDASAGPLSLSFDSASLAFVPGDIRPLAVQVEPRGRYTVRFALIGDARDAFLNTSETSTDDSGTATVELSAPSSPATFSVLAAASARTATLPVSAGTTFTQVSAVPLYAGHRVVESWVATAETGSNCDSSAGVPPLDGPLTSTAIFGKDPVLMEVPVGTPLTIKLRAGNFAFGCTELAAAVAGQRNQVSVIVTDRPLQMGGVSMPVRLGITTVASWRSAWSALEDELSDAFVGGQKNDPKALLDAMEAATTLAARTDFALQRSTMDWDQTVAVALGGVAHDALRDAIDQFLDAALGPLVSASLEGALISPETPSGRAALTLASIDGVSPSAGGFASKTDVSWSSTNDQILFGGTVSLKASEFAAGLALAGARAAGVTASSVPSALSTTLSCSSVAAALVNPATSVAFGTCDAACVASTCERALATMWTRAAATADDSATLSISATGAATVDDGAHPAGFTGTWVGTLTVPGAIAQLSGSALGGTAAASSP